MAQLNAYTVDPRQLVRQALEVASLQFDNRTTALALDVVMGVPIAFPAQYPIAEFDANGQPVRLERFHCTVQADAIERGIALRDGVRDFLHAQMARSRIEDLEHGDTGNGNAQAVRTKDALEFGYIPRAGPVHGALPFHHQNGEASSHC
jgi:hypothetical protein